MSRNKETSKDYQEQIPIKKPPLPKPGPRACSVRSDNALAAKSLVKEQADMADGETVTEKVPDGQAANRK